MTPTQLLEIISLLIGVIGGGLAVAAAFSRPLRQVEKLQSDQLGWQRVTERRLNNHESDIEELQEAVVTLNRQHSELLMELRVRMEHIEALLETIRSGLHCPAIQTPSRKDA